MVFGRGRSSTTTRTLNTAFRLAAQENGRPIIPLDDMRRDDASHLTLDTVTRKLSSGNIPLPLFRSEESQKAPKGVHLTDIALYLDERRKAAVKLRDQMTGGGGEGRMGLHSTSLSARKSELGGRLTFAVCGPKRGKRPEKHYIK
ncbi:pyocin activator PrtN family protein [Lichenihabitans psoromatis]|uniref:pyocin activator PrtN family protein n=1 Tax=Lichenihabitans psoromatis TaxID=2528642 RepID=UPI0010356B83|nr:pyocin activator PrtN family protein [Lichenihabitans psoromatis]